LNKIIRLIRKKWRGIAFWLFYKQLFNKFLLYIVKDAKEKEEIYRLRYQVYCEEYKYIDAKKHPDGLEIDEYDKYADILVIRDKEGEIAATVRIINKSVLGFPIEKHFSLKYPPAMFSEGNVVEISRLIVAKKYRKKHLVIFLLKGLYVIAIQIKASKAFCIIDEKLYPLLRQLHVPVNKIGEKQIYQGVTFPCVIIISEWIEDVRKSRAFQSFFTYGGFEYQEDHDKYVIH